MDDNYTLVVGASTNPSRYSNIAIHSLRKHGYSVQAYGLKSGEVSDVTIITEWSNIKESIDTVSLYVGAQHQNPEFIQKIMNLKPRRLIFNPGTENIQFVNLAKEHGIEPVNACTLVMLSTNQY